MAKHRGNVVLLVTTGSEPQIQKKMQLIFNNSTHTYNLTGYTELHVAIYLLVEVTSQCWVFLYEHIMTYSRLTRAHHDLFPDNCNSLLYNGSISTGTSWHSPFQHM